MHDRELHNLGTQQNLHFKYHLHLKTKNALGSKGLEFQKAFHMEMENQMFDK